MQKDPSPDGSGDNTTTEFSPKNFLKARRPELFSDSILIKNPLFSKDEFGFLLNKLTSLKKEIEFEHFCRKLAEKEICPNLIPQTGPTGGGDSKVDTETFPVAEEIAIRWYYGIEAARERWAFAFSAKEDWRSKVKSDVEKIINTDRDYKRIYFITNQFVKDKLRGEIQDEFQKKYSVPVTILDQTWIVERVFQNQHLSIVAETLGISEDRIIEKKKIGIQDFSREDELIQLDNLIKDTTRYKGVEYQQAMDCLQGALLARALEKPTAEVDGRFNQAARIARKNWPDIQLKRIIYLHARTMYWWYNDIFAFNDLYKKLEELIFESPTAWHLVWLVHLFQLAENAFYANAISSEEANIEERKRKLREALLNLKENQISSASLIARSQLWLLDLLEALRDDKNVSDFLKELEEMFEIAERLPEFPVRHLQDLFEGLDDLFSKLPFYDNFFEKFLSLKSERIQEGEKGRLLFKQGLKKLEWGEPYKAIEYFGRSWLYLAKEEYRSQHAAMHFNISNAYASVGLLFAARAHMAMAIDLSLSNFVKKGEKIPTIVLAGFYRLIWIELKLANIAKVLSWIRLSIAAEKNIYLTNEEKEGFREEYCAIDQILGILLLKTKYEDLIQLGSLPEILKDFGLIFARSALLHALGYEQPVREELKLDGDLNDFFSEFLNQPICEDLPPCPNFFVGQNATLFTNILGCQINMSTRNQKANIFLAENLLSILETFFATGFIEKFAPYRESLDIKVITPEMNGQPFGYVIEENDCGDPTLRVVFPVKVDEITHFAKEQNYHKNIIELIVTIVELIAIIPSTSSSVDIKEEIFKRTLNISASPIALNNLLDPDVKIRWQDWQVDYTNSPFSLMREKVWYDSVKSAVMKKLNFSKEPPDTIFSIDKLKHRQQKVLNLIDVRLWENAKWIGFAYGVTNFNNMPFIALQFQDINIGSKIFRGWIKKFGKVDEKNLISITIVTDIVSDDDLVYRVVISTNLQEVEILEETKLIMEVPRLHTFKARDLNTLENFKSLEDKEYFIFPVSTASQRPLSDLIIKKSKIRVISATDIGQNDPAICGVLNQE